MITITSITTVAFESGYTEEDDRSGWTPIIDRHLLVWVGGGWKPKHRVL